MKFFSKAPADRVQQQTKRPAPKSLSMHDNVPVWYDCCSCEAEPYWEEAMEQDESPDEKLSASASDQD